MSRLPSSPREAPGAVWRWDMAPRHALYDWCNEVLAEAEFDEAVEMLCRPYYKDGSGRPSVPPGRYFRMLFGDQFERSEVGGGDRLAVRRFLVVAPVPAADGGRSGTRSLYAQRHPLAVAAEGPPRRVRFAARDRGQARSGARQADRRRCLDPAGQCRPAPLGAAGIPARITRRCCNAWLGRAASRR